MVCRMRILRPRLIIFASIGVFDAFYRVYEEFADALGARVGDAEPLWWPPAPSGTRSVRAMVAKFEACRVIGLPHPTGHRAPNAAIKILRPILSPIIDEFKTAIAISHNDAGS